MAIISEQAYIANGTQREFQVVGTILSDSHIGVWIVDYSTIPVTETRLPTARYDVLGSTVLLDVPPQSGLTVSLVLTDNGEGIEIPPSEITDISANINKIINVTDNIEYIITNSDNMQSIIDTASIKDEVWMKSVTFDNWMEFAYHYKLRDFWVETYFCNPYL